MIEELALTTFDTWTLRTRPGTGNKILLLLHGWTGDEGSMTIFTRNFPKEYWIISPRAPFETLPSGYSWRAPAPRGSLPSVDLFRPSVDALINLINKWAALNKLDGTRVDVVGFSQGGALTFTLGVLHPERVSKMGILSGFAPEGIREVLTPNLLFEKKIFVAHGSHDDMVPISMAMDSVDLLKRAGANVIFCESEAGHKLSSECLRALENYLQTN